ncbi:hypothetical protein Fleli_2535 [Bernardetia litoralis DSM 6794]|uniref:Lipoprotein n=1 Tax=Bernardetia litoralis (strain ATCC 23117 / DSM 6794 / NBRC 15988 / NCIMB 1366 / Fx l1 / Sio-4) TaxID=880071 RepID=I4ALR5_BERLS|nr:hypothetical protein [Bernardetia litoralis]AFM04900.1 hypothetical protein Fleli_2535 [Bernardetia litoralis DSM 6794]
MKNKTIFSISLWVLIGILSCAYFFLKERQEEKNIKLLEKSSIFLIEKSKRVFLEKLHEGETLTEELGNDPRDVSLYGSLRNNYEFSDSLFKTDNYKWVLLKKYLRDSSYQNIISTKSTELLNYENPNSLFLQKLHKMVLYRICNQAQIIEFSRVSYCGVSFDKLYLNLTSLLSPKIFLHYSDNPKLFSYQLYQNSQPIENLYFDVEKDTTLHFQIRTDYYANDTLKNTKNYKLKIKTGQRNDFEIEKY